jgi:hypothetical protein
MQSLEQNDKMNQVETIAIAELGSETIPHNCCSSRCRPEPSKSSDIELIIRVSADTNRSDATTDIAQPLTVIEVRCLRKVITESSGYDSRFPPSS